MVYCFAPVLRPLAQLSKLDNEIGDDAFPPPSPIIQLNNSNEFGKMFTKLDNSDDLEQLEDNQVITEQGSSLLYESKSYPFLFNLMADFDGDIYNLVITEIED